MITNKDLEQYNKGFVTDDYIYEKCETDLEIYNFYANNGLDEDDIKEAMYRVSGANDAYYNALDLKENSSRLKVDKEKERKDLMNECDMLQGNINRMMVTNNHEELLTMFAYAHKRLGEIYWGNKKRINENALSEQEVK